MDEDRLDYIDGRYAAVAVSFLGLFEKMDEAYVMAGDDIGHDFIQKTFEELALTKVGGQLSIETLSHFHLVEGDMELYKFLLLWGDRMNPVLKTVFDDVVKIGIEGQKVGQYYVEASHYDKALHDLAAGRVGIPMERSETGVYELIM